MKKPVKKKPEAETYFGWALVGRNKKGVWFHRPLDLRIDKDNARSAGAAGGWQIARVKVTVELQGPLYDADTGRKER